MTGINMVEVERAEVGMEIDATCLRSERIGMAAAPQQGSIFYEAKAVHDPRKGNGAAGRHASNSSDSRDSPW